MPVQELGLGLLWYAIFVVSTTFHEAAHGFMAWRFGDPTARRAGLVTLDPLPHIRRSPFGMVVIPLLSFFSGGWMVGWASTPYDPYWAQVHRQKAAFMSLAGPAANLILVIVAALLIHAGMLLDLFAQPQQVTWTQTTVARSPGFATGAAVAVSILFSLNLILLVFNLLPVPPLDGYHVLNDLVLRRQLFAPQKVAMAGQVLLIALIVTRKLDFILGAVRTGALAGAGIAFEALFRLLNII